MRPVTIIAGYLGAGKTTLVNHLLRHPGGRRLGVLVNEFGTLPIDADLIEGAEDGLLSITGGCICCSYGDDLLTALMDLSRRTTLDHILIECSGVALPGPIARTLTLPGGLALDAILVLADAETIIGRAADRYIGDTIARQLPDADLVLLNKTDLVANTAPILEFLAQAAPQARVLTTRHAAIAADVVLGLTSAFDPTSEQPPHGTDGHDDASFRLRRRIDTGALAAALTAPELGLVRAKGFAQHHDGAWHTIQIVGRRAAITPAPAQEQGPGRLVCIAHGTDIDRARIARLLSETP